MQQFDLSLWLQDKSRKVCTRDGREVEIVKYDMKGTHFPVLYVISNEDSSQEPCECSKSGMCQFDNTQSSTDLFFADEELTEFEKELQIIISEASHWTSDDGNISTYCQFGDKEIKKISGQLLDLARKELETNYYTKVLDDRMVFKSDLHDRELQTAYDMGKQDALKDLPKWKKITEEKQNYLAYGYLSHDEYYLSIKELIENLPKEK